MLHGEGSRKVGEPCWSHAQCVRDQPNTLCHGLVCVCDSGLHNYNGKCSRNVWEDIGLAPWELIIVAFVLTLFAFAVFVGCMYFVISKFLSYRRTSPSEILTATESFKGGDNLKKQSSVDSSTKAIKIYETKLVNDSSVEVESQLIDEEAVTFSRESVSTASTHIVEPVRFITPLAYKSGDSESWQSSRRSSDSRGGTMPHRNPNQHRFTRAWSATTTYDDSDDWFQPNRNHIRRLDTQRPRSRWPRLGRL